MSTCELCESSNMNDLYVIIFIVISWLNVKLCNQPPEWSLEWQTCNFIKMSLLFLKYSCY